MSNLHGLLRPSLGKLHVTTHKLRNTQITSEKEMRKQKKSTWFVRIRVLELTELRLLLTKEQEATQSIPKLENGPASKHVKELLAGGYLIISGPDPNLRLQLKE